MVISLESQNVKIKRTPNIEFRAPQTIKSLPTININRRFIPYMIGVFVFSLIFATGWHIFIPTHVSEVDLEAVVFPSHRADVVSRDEIASYDKVVQENYFTIKEVSLGETLSNLAITYGVSRESILHVNGISDVKKLDEFSSLKIPQSDGFLHEIGSKDSLEGLSNEYNIPIKDIFRANGLKSEAIDSLDSLFIPGVNPVEWGWRSNLDRFFVYPVNGYISKRFGFHTNSITGLTSLYEGLDFIPIDDFTVYASRGGTVSRIGYSANYGNYIYIDHSGGTRTLYAHLEQISVSSREHVLQGDVIGSVGKSGFTSEAKLFFSLFYKDESIDPEKYLK